MNYFPYLFLFFFGLAAGSFLNVVSLRYRPGEKLLDLKIIDGRSRCLHCGKELVWYELIPLISFLVQKGKCRGCGQKLSFQYPLVEFLSGLIFVFVPLALTYNGHWSLVIIWLLVFELFLLLSIIDFRHYIIPDSINLFLAVLGIVLIIFKSMGQWSVVSGQWSFLGHYSLLFGLIENIWLNHFFAAVLAMIFFAAIIILSRGKGMGWGDFKLAAAFGIIFGWPDIIVVIFLAFVVGAIFTAPLLIKKQKTMKDIVPFGPFLVIGSSLVFFLGKQLIDGYFKLFNF